MPSRLSLIYKGNAFSGFKNNLFIYFSLCVYVCAFLCEGVQT